MYTKNQSGITFTRCNPEGEKVTKATLEKEVAKDKALKNEIFINLFEPVEPKYTFEDIILPKSVYDKIMDVADYTKNSMIVFEKWGLNKTHKYSKRIGINLYGEPGTGKTMVAHAIAKHLNRKIIIVSYADLESKYVGETPKNIRKVFDVGRETRSIIFFDEADAILSKRVTNMNNSTDVSVNQTRSVMLMQMNEYEDFIIFATNFIQNFDPAFMRRISQHIEFKLPDEECRRKLWNLYIPHEMPNDINIDDISVKYDGISGSDISTAILKAAFRAARNGDQSVKDLYVREAIEDIKDAKLANLGEIKNVKVTEVSEEDVRGVKGDKFVDDILNNESSTN